MKALSVRAPWWWFILHAGKDVENRDWSTKFRGRVLIHASKWFRKQEMKDDAEDAIILAGWRDLREKWPTVEGIRAGCGCIVGSVEIVDCVTHSDSPWFSGKYGFVLRDPQFFKPFPFKGALGFFDVPDEAVSR
jgi:hypothetical protein